MRRSLLPSLVLLALLLAFPARAARGGDPAEAGAARVEGVGPHTVVDLDARFARKIVVLRVVLVAGSGPTDRDGNQAAHLRPDTLRLLAEALAAGFRGVALVGHSEGALLATLAAEETPVDAERLAGAREGVEKAVLVGMNHVLKRAATPAEQQRSYASPEQPLHPALAPRLLAFLRGAMGDESTPPVR